MELDVTALLTVFFNLPGYWNGKDNTCVVIYMALFCSLPSYSILNPLFPLSSPIISKREEKAYY